jgi:hypothetical protein
MNTEKQGESYEGKKGKNKNQAKAVYLKKVGRFFIFPK